MVIEDKHVEEFNKLFDYIYKGNELAKQLSFDLLYIIHVWDDLVDKDVERTYSEVNNAFIKAIIDLPANPLWCADMRANFLNVYLRWHDANMIEDSSERFNDLAKAYMLRAGIYDMFVLLANKLYGLDWAAQVGMTVRLSYGESLSDFVKEVRNA